MPTYRTKWPVYAKQWDEMHLIASRQAEINQAAKRLFSNKARYAKVEATTGVPWYLIAALHYRESDANFNTYLGNGDPLSYRTTHVPRGRGPFSSWESGAIDALRLDGLSRVIDWRLEKDIFYAELFNGWGYHNRGLPSPYIWGGTSIQKAGKYVADGQWSSTAWDKQLGVAAIIRGLMNIDASIKPIRETDDSKIAEPVPAQRPKTAEDPAPGVLPAILRFLGRLFSRP